MPQPRHSVVQYLYVHAPGEAFAYPTMRAKAEVASVAARYLECALVQAASLRLADTDCDLFFVLNVKDPRDTSVLGSRGVRLIEAMEDLGVKIVFAEYAHRHEAPIVEYVSSRYILDAIEATTGDGGDVGRYLWFTDVDCVWPHPAAVFDRSPSEPEIGCLLIPYPADWDIMGATPQSLGEFGRELGPCPVPIPWVGGELVGGTPQALRQLVAACEALEAEAGVQPTQLAAEEHLLSLVGGLGRISFDNLWDVGRRVFTGGRHQGPRLDDPTDFGFWHLPLEKGLSFRRTADALLAGRHDELSRDFSDPRRMARRFNVAGAGLARRLRDDGWLAANRVRGMIERRR
ncbi:MAG TPA: hypothetical protein VGI67_08165 [Thermoleophilaceae bacterium]|jgi:hypothetical protein